MALLKLLGSLVLGVIAAFVMLELKDPRPTLDGFFGLTGVCLTIWATFLAWSKEHEYHIMGDHLFAIGLGFTIGSALDHAPGGWWWTYISGGIIVLNMLIGYVANIVATHQEQNHL